MILILADREVFLCNSFDTLDLDITSVEVNGSQTTVSYVPSDFTVI